MMGWICMRRMIVLFGMLLFALVLASCSQKRQAIEGAELDTVLAYSEPAADRFFQGLNENDYALFSTDFASVLDSSVGEKGLQDMQTSILGKTGKYLSREVSRVEQDDKFVSVFYDAEFEQEEHVTARLVFD